MIFTATPNKAIKNMNFPFIGTGFLIRSIASKTKYTVIIQTKAIEAKAPKVCALWNPKVKVLVAIFRDIRMASTLVKKPAISISINKNSK